MDNITPGFAIIPGNSNVSTIQGGICIEFVFDINKCFIIESWVIEFANINIKSRMIVYRIAIDGVGNDGVDRGVGAVEECL